MRRSTNSLQSLTSLPSLPSSTSINSITKINNNRDFQKYVADIEYDIIKVSNDYYYFTNKFNKKINNIINRYEGRTNSLFIDIRNRESDYRKLNIKIKNIIKDFNEYKNNTCICTNVSNYMTISHDNIKDIDNIYRNINIFMYIYTSFVLVMITYYCIRI
jgi:hypothetical protein|uniref:Uncharacterized protein n=1 Tax=viral metagenome TaxID=1070528 RepID=A0A6C0LVT7_9ZZZZ